MRVLNVSSTINPISGGGEAERTYQMSLALQQFGVDCHVLTLDTDLSIDRKQFLGRNNITIIPCLAHRFLIPKPLFFLINRLVKKSDIVHLMGHWTILNALTYFAIRLNNKKYVVCPAGALPLFGRSKFIKIIYNFVIGKAIIKNASMCIAVTDNEINSFTAYGVDRNRIQVIPNGITSSDFSAIDNVAFRKKHGLGQSPFLLFVGRLNLIKGPDLLLNAFLAIANQYPDLNLVYVGPDAGMLTELKLIVKENNMSDRIFFLGYLGGNEKSQAYHAASLLVIPSRQEAMSIVVLEAGICGTPVLITNQCGFDVLNLEGAGWVVGASINDLIEGLNRIFFDSNSLKVSGARLKLFISNRYLWPEIVKDYLALYLKIQES